MGCGLGVGVVFSLVFSGLGHFFFYTSLGEKIFFKGEDLVSEQIDGDVN